MKKLLLTFYIISIFTIFSLISADCFASPDGQIVFIRDGDVWIASTDGTNAKPLTFSQNSRHPSISPAGKLIVFTSGYNPKTGFGHLYSMTSQC